LLESNIVFSSAIALIVFPWWLIMDLLHFSLSTLIVYWIFWTDWLLIIIEHDLLLDSGTFSNDLLIHHEVIHVRQVQLHVLWVFWFLMLLLLLP
jgi:hypothetical protein